LACLDAPTLFGVLGANALAVFMLTQHFAVFDRATEVTA
jgi:hypothetical protein